MKILDFLKENILYTDGAMGTLLQQRGLNGGESPVLWNVKNPGAVTEIHKSYLDAGSNLVLANTFSANALNFTKEQLDTLIPAAIGNARKAQKETSNGNPSFVALDIGPLGRLLKPYGDLEFEDAVALFSETVRRGRDADLIFIETFTDLYETKAAVLAAKENSDLPVFVCNAYSENGRLLTGATPETVIATLEGLKADAIGVNCSFGPEALAPVVEKYLKSSSVPVIFKPNAGLPDSDGCYSLKPADFAAEALPLLKGGVRIIGGCCGTSPEYIAELVGKSRGICPGGKGKQDISVVTSATKAYFFGDRPCLIGERINPTGKKRLKQALADNDFAYILGEALKQAEKGADILDVNVGMPKIDEKAVLPALVREIQAVTDLPLQIDTSDVIAMEKAMRLYNGKPMVNSVNGKQESMDAVFPLVKKYGGLVVCLTLDENGIPATAEERVEIAKKIAAEAEKYSIERKDLIFDALVLAVSADNKSAAETLKAVRLLSSLGFKTSLGVSNISFGLPERESLNGVFFTMALQNGLDAAIINPNSDTMLGVCRSFCLLNGMDENCSDYIGFCSSRETAVPSKIGEVKKSAPEYGSLLQEAVVKGLRDEAGKITANLLQSEEPMEIINAHLIPALDIVGKEYEAGRFFLPQLLMSAEAVSGAFGVIKSKAAGRSGEKRITVVLATVKGDIHDIGKNIVRMLLENYGFNVIDLGRDVPPETVLGAVKANNAPVLGLSALMTTTLASMEETVALVKKECPSVKIAVGGAVLTKEFAASIGADCYAKDAMATVRFAESVEKESLNRI